MENIFLKAAKEDAAERELLSKAHAATGADLESRRTEAERQRERAYQETAADLFKKAAEE